MSTFFVEVMKVSNFVAIVSNTYPQIAELKTTAYFKKLLNFDVEPYAPYQKICLLKSDLA